MLKTSISDVRHLGHNADCVSSLNPSLDRQNEVVGSCLGQKGVEFDPFKIGVVQPLPETQILQGVLLAHPVLYNVFRFGLVLLSCDVCNTDVINTVDCHRSDICILTWCLANLFSKPLACLTFLDKNNFYPIQIWCCVFTAFILRFW